MDSTSGVNKKISYYSTVKPTQPIGTSSEAAAPVPAVVASLENTSTSSQPKLFLEIASDARKSLDAKYQHLGLSLEMCLHKTGDFRRDIFDGMDFDRRALFAVASNEGGQFASEEIRAAKSTMVDQLRSAMKAAGGLIGRNDAVGHKAAIEFLDGAASYEEKASFVWAKQRATAQVSYQIKTRGRGESIDSGNAVVNHLVRAYYEFFLAYEKNESARWENMPSYDLALQESKTKK